MGITRGPNIVTDGLVFMADAANPSSYPGSGTAWNDLTATQNNGTLTNGPTFDSANGGNINFDGSNDIVEFGSSNLLTGDNCQNITLSGWVKWTSTLAGYIASIKRSSSNSTLFAISTNQKTSGGTQAGTACIVSRNAADNAHIYTFFDGNYNDGAWHNVVGRVDGGDGTLFVDGIARAGTTTGMQDVSSNTANFTIGGFRVGAPDHHLDGNIAQVSVYRRSLDNDEILHNYNALDYEIWQHNNSYNNGWISVQYGCCK